MCVCMCVCVGGGVTRIHLKEGDLEVTCAESAQKCLCEIRLLHIPSEDLHTTLSPVNDGTVSTVGSPAGP